jgi:hypothetical protein
VGTDPVTVLGNPSSNGSDTNLSLQSGFGPGFFDEQLPFDLGWDFCNGFLLDGPTWQPGFGLGFSA